jgi:general secretion pathway protein C
MLQSVSLRAASIAMGPGQASVLLELAPLPPPATGSLSGLLPPSAAVAPAPILAPPPPPPPMPTRPAPALAQ